MSKKLQSVHLDNSYDFTIPKIVVQARATGIIYTTSSIILSTTEYIRKQEVIDALNQEKAEFVDIKFNDGEFNFFLENLANNTVTKRIEFFSEVFNEQQIIEFSRVLETNQTIESLEIKGKFSSASIGAIIQMLKNNNHLKKIKLANCNLAIALAESLKENTSLQILDLSHYNIGDEGVKALAESLKENTSLQVLDLTHCNIGDEGHCNIGDEGAKALAESLKENTSLQILDLSHCNIGDEGVKALAESLEYNTGLRELTLNSHYMTDGVFPDFCRAFRFNNTLEKLAIYGSNTKINGNVLPMLKDPECKYNTLPYGMMTKPYGKMTKKAYSLPSEDDDSSTTEQSAPKDDDTIPTPLQDTLTAVDETPIVGEASTPEETSEGSIL